MHPNLIMNSIGWIFITFLGISKLLYSEQLSSVTTGFGGLICFMIALYLAFFRPFRKKDKILHKKNWL